MIREVGGIQRNKRAVEAAIPQEGGGMEEDSEEEEEEEKEEEETKRLSGMVLPRVDPGRSLLQY